MYFTGACFDPALIHSLLPSFRRRSLNRRGAAWSLARRCLQGRLRCNRHTDYLFLCAKKQQLFSQTHTNTISHEQRQRQSKTVNSRPNPNRSLSKMARLNGLFVLLVGLTITVTVSARYQLVQDYSGTNFYRNFDFFTGPDPTQGHVQYKNIVDANATGIAGFINGGNATNAVFMAVDTSEVAPQGRGSVRVTSKQSFDRFLLVADIVHMPEGCGTWPAFWTVGRNVRFPPTFYTSTQLIRSTVAIRRRDRHHRRRQRPNRQLHDPPHLRLSPTPRPNPRPGSKHLLQCKQQILRRPHRNLQLRNRRSQPIRKPRLRNPRPLSINLRHGLQRRRRRRLRSRTHILEYPHVVLATRPFPRRHRQRLACTQCRPLQLGCATSYLSGGLQHG